MLKLGEVASSDLTQIRLRRAQEQDMTRSILLCHFLARGGGRKSGRLATSKAKINAGTYLTP